MRARRKRLYLLEQLETRTLLSYTFSLTGQIATVSPVAATGGPILIDEVVVGGNPLLEWSQDNGSTFSTDWDSATPGTQTLAANSSSTIDLTPTTGAGSSITLGDMSSAASNIFAMFHLGVVGTPANVSLTIDDQSSTHAAGTYDFYSTLGTITGPGGAQGGINFTSFGPVNSYLVEGGPAGNTFNIHSTFNATTASTSIVGGAGDDTANVLGDTSPAIGTPLSIDLGGGTNTVHVGNGNVSTTIDAPVSVTDTGGTTTLDLDNTGDATSATATITSSAVHIGAAGAVNYGAGVTALNINGGAPAAGVTYNINSTQAGTTTTVNGGANTDTFVLSPTANDLSDLAGPVVINGNGGTNSITLDDQLGAGGAYAIGSTTVTAPGFAGLTYGTITNLTLNSANIASTIDVNGTGTGGVLNVSTGTGGSTVNVVADNEPVNLNLGDSDVVNIGSTGGAGTMAGILGAIDIIDTPSFYTLTFHDENDTTGNTWTLDNDDTSGMFGTASVALSGGIATTTYQPGDLNSPLTINGGSGANTFIVNNTTSLVETDLNTGFGDDTVNVFATGTHTLDIQGQDGNDTVTLGGLAGIGMQKLGGTINVMNTLDFSSLTLDDSEDLTGQTALMSDDGTTGTVTGLAPATINYTDTDISSLTVLGGSGGNSFTVQGTLVNADFPATLTTLNKGPGGPNTVDVNATSAGSTLDIVGTGGPDSVTIGNGSQTTILGLVNVVEAPGSTNLIIDLSSDGLPHNLDLSSDGTTGTLSDTLGNLPQNITYNVAALLSLTIDTDPTENETLNLSFAGGGNPIPTGGSPGLIFNAGDPVAGVTHALNISGELPSGPFASEIHNANDQTVFPQVGQYGSVFFTEAPPDPGVTGPQTSLDYTGLQPITDTTPATLYTFNDFGYPDQSFSASFPGTLIPLVPDSIEFANVPTPSTPLNFETTDILNKINVVFNTPALIAGQPGNGVFGLVNIPTAYVGPFGLASLTFNTSTGNDNTVDFIATPAGVVTTLNGSSASDTTNVLGTGIAAGTVLTVDGGPGHDTLNYNAGGEVPTITPGLLPDEVLITIPGAGIVDALYYNAINITNAAAPPAPVVVTTPTINTIEGFQLVDAVLGTFTFPIAPNFPAGTTLPAGLPPSDFTATFAWGDGTTTAAKIVQDASDPSIYYVEGTHTYTNAGLYLTGLTVSYAGGVVSGVVNGTPVTITLPTSTAAPVGITTASVTDGVLAVTAFPIVGTEGLPIASGPIATFIDNGGADPAGDYSASIAITDSSGFSLLLTAASITQVGSSEQFIVKAPAITLPQEGPYQFVVSVTDSSSIGPFTSEGASLAVIADAPLTAGAPVALTPNTGVALPASTIVGTFTDANPGATPADFKAVIDWGDGSPVSLGTVVVNLVGGFSVDGGHIYAKPGTYATLINVTDEGGSTVTLSGTVTATDLPVALLTAPPFTATEGINTGTFVLFTFTDPNTLATAVDVNAQLAVGGWGDGSPAAAGVNLVVQVTGVVPLIPAGPTSGDPIFAILGSHTYDEETPAGLPETLSVIVTTLGGATTTFTDPPGGGVTVLDARLTGFNGTITGIEGNTTGTVRLGSFVDGNPVSTLADFTAMVAWGDGTTSAGTITQPGGVGTPYLVSGSHTYAEEGTYAYIVTVDDDGGQSTTFSGSAVIADADLIAAGTQPTVSTTEAAIYPLPEFALPVFSGPVGVFSDLNPAAPASDFTATIDWGDGTTSTAGTITQPGGVGTAFSVSGSHTYASTGTTGTYPIQVFIVDSGGSRLTVSNSASVAAVPIVLTGILNPMSDSGKSHTDHITNVAQPNFYGTSQAYSNVTLAETPVGGGTTVTIGQTEAGSNGSWSITSNILASGTYTITATATDQFGLHATGPVTITPSLVVDTAPPVITDLTFNRFDATLTVTFQDGLSGMDLASLTNSAFYHISATPLVSDVHVPRLVLPTSISYTPGALPTDPVVVNVVFNNGHTVRGGNYEVFINSGTGDTGIQDVAGNALDGNYYGSFPTGDGLAGGNFVADIVTFHNQVSPFIPITAGYVPPVKGIDPPAGSSHAGKTHKTVHVKTKAPVIKTTVAQKIKVQKTTHETFDHALNELVAEIEAKQHKK